MAEQERRNQGRRREGLFGQESREVNWVPKTKLGKEVVEGKYENLEEILESGKVILEPGIVDKLVPDLEQEIIFIGGSPGKGGGIRRTATKRTARMHKSGRRFKLTAIVVVGDKKNLVGVGKASSKEHRTAIEKATTKAKLNMIRVRMGCGNWECACGGEHSIPFRTEAKHGSVRVILSSAPKGVGIVADRTTKKMLGLAGISDIWLKTYGTTGTRGNLVYAVFAALKNLNRTKGDI
jgi:small subunit ribosomal protein S5